MNKKDRKLVWEFYKSLEAKSEAYDKKMNEALDKEDQRSVAILSTGFSEISKIRHDFFTNVLRPAGVLPWRLEREFVSRQTEEGAKRNTSKALQEFQK